MQLRPTTASGEDRNQSAASGSPHARRQLRPTTASGEDRNYGRAVPADERANCCARPPRRARIATPGSWTARTAGSTWLRPTTASGEDRNNNATMRGQLLVAGLRPTTASGEDRNSTANRNIINSTVAAPDHRVGRGSQPVPFTGITLTRYLLRPTTASGEDRNNFGRSPCSVTVGVAAPDHRVGRGSQPDRPAPARAV